jgi:two-component system, cell cycle sensor histidine kinase and response regulator CckA
MQSKIQSIDVPPTSSEADQPEEAVSPGRGMLLLVEDEDTVRKVMAEALQSEGFRVLEAPNGLKAFALYLEHREDIDAIITDVRMPQMSGWELASRIKNLDCDARFLFISAYKHSEVCNDSTLEADMAFLQKPFTLLTLVEKVHRLMGKRQVAASSSS